MFRILSTQLMKQFLSDIRWWPAREKTVIPSAHLPFPLLSPRGSNCEEKPLKACLMASLVAACLECQPAQSLHDCQMCCKLIYGGSTAGLMCMEHAKTELMTVFIFIKQGPDNLRPCRVRRCAWQWHVGCIEACQIMLVQLVFQLFNLHVAQSIVPRWLDIRIYWSRVWSN